MENKPIMVLNQPELRTITGPGTQSMSPLTGLVPEPSQYSATKMTISSYMAGGGGPCKRVGEAQGFSEKI